MVVGQGTVIFIFRNQAVIDGRDGFCAMGCVYFTFRSQCGRHGGAGCAQLLRQPYFHSSRTTVSPCVVRYQCQAHIGSGQATLIVVAKCLCAGLQLVDAIQEIGLFYHFKLRVAVHEYAEDVEVIIREFCTVYNRSAFYGNASAVGFHFIVGFHDTRFHVEVYFHLVTLFPTAVDAEITIFQLILYGFSVYFHCVLQTLAVTIGIQVTGNYLTPNPSGNTDFQVELSGAVLVDADGDVAVPRVLGGLLDRNSFATHFQVGSIGHEEVNVNVLILHSVDIPRQGRDETADVGRAAGTTEPGLALMLSHTFQRVGVEETATVQGYA